MKNLSIITKPANPVDKPATLNTHKREDGKVVDLNFKVPAELHREFKIFAVANDMTMKDVLIQAFDALKAKKLKS